jgi:hypothetical protein
MQIEPDDELAHLDADEEASPLIRRWLGLAKDLMSRATSSSPARSESRSSSDNETEEED